MADTMRQSMKLGLRGLVERLSPDPLKNLKPFAREESRRCFATPDPDFDAFAAHCAIIRSNRLVGEEHTHQTGVGTLNRLLRSPLPL